MRHKENCRQKTNRMVFLGAHFSITGGLHKAIESARICECTALQIFTKNSNTWKERVLAIDEISLFKSAKNQSSIVHVAAHTSYLINLASPEEELWTKSCGALKHELTRSSQLNIPFVVVHPGAHKGFGEKRGIKRIADGINKVLSDVYDLKVQVLLETTAGQGTSVGYTFEQLASILRQVEHKDRIGVCFDTAHVFAAGYDLRSRMTYEETMNEFLVIVGLENIKLIHLNDSKKQLGSHVDRHEHIGEGYIGEEAFQYIMNDERFESIPKIIETPKKKNGIEYDPINLDKLRAMINKGASQ